MPPVDLPRPWDAAPAPPEPDLLVSGPQNRRRPSRRDRRRADDTGTGPAEIAHPAAEANAAATGAAPARAGTTATAADATGADAAGADAAGAARRGDGWRRWAGGRFGRRELLVALVVGLVLGGLLVHGYDGRLAEQARRDAIALTARVAPTDTAGGQGRESWLLRVVVANRGATTLRLRSATLAGTPLRSVLRSVSRNVSLPAGKETWISLDVSGACAGGGLTRPPSEVDLVVVAGDRPERHVRVDLADDTSLLLSAARQTCMDANFALWATAEQDGAVRIDRSGLSVPLRFRSNWSPPWVVSGVRAEGSGLAATIAGALPIRFTDGVTPATTVRWTVTDCVQAKALGYTDLRLRTTLTLPGAARSVEVTTTLNGALSELVPRFVRLACR